MRIAQDRDRFFPREPSRMTTDPGTRLLIAGELPDSLRALEEAPGAEHGDVRRASSEEGALALLAGQEFGLAVLDRRAQQALAARLQDALRLRDEFMALVVHELRTPLSVLAMEARVRQHHLASGDEAWFTGDNLAKMLERDQRQVRGLTHLVDDLLDASRIRQGQLALHRGPCELAALLRRVIDDVSARHGGAAVALDAECAPLPGEWDEFRLEQVFVNLLDNALRYGEGRPVSARLERGAATATIRVHDEGVGIAPEDLARVFEPFTRVGGPGCAKGFGLGLFIAKRIVEAHGGTIAADSPPGAGTTFSVTLPVG
jgi:signal transduction histidine kinase